LRSKNVKLTQCTDIQILIQILCNVSQCHSNQLKPQYSTNNLSTKIQTRELLQQDIIQVGLKHEHRRL